MMRFPQSLIFAQRYRIRTCSCVPIIPTDARESCLRWYCSPIYSAGVRLEGHPLESRSTEICDRHRLRTRVQAIPEARSQLATTRRSCHPCQPRSVQICTERSCKVVLKTHVNCGDRCLALQSFY